MPSTTPRRIAHAARNIALASCPGAPAVLLSWAAGTWPHGHPYTAVMLFCLGLSITAVAAMVWALAACHVAVAHAFSMGLQAGQRGAAPAPRGPRRAPALRAVE